jgi:uncharacterized protein (TIGR02266 family)
MDGWLARSWVDRLSVGRPGCGDGDDVMATVSLESHKVDSSDAEDDRRRARRAGVTVRIDYATVDEMFSEFTRDINEGGLFIETEKPHQPGTEVSMQFHLPGSNEVLSTIGRVVRVSSGDVGTPPGMGIEFDELTAADRLKIDAIIRSLRAEAAL